MVSDSLFSTACAFLGVPVKSLRYSERAAAYCVLFLQVLARPLLNAGLVDVDSS